MAYSSMVLKIYVAIYTNINLATYARSAMVKHLKYSCKYIFKLPQIV